MSLSGPDATAAADDPLTAIAAALFRPLGVEGVYARSALYEGVIERLAAFISWQRDPLAEVLRFPPVMSRRQLEKSGYLKSFPNLLGCVCALHGSEATIRAAADRHESGGDWTTGLAASDLVLSPAACYPLYPLVADRGRLPAGGDQATRYQGPHGRPAQAGSFGRRGHLPGNAKPWRFRLQV